MKQPKGNLTSTQLEILEAIWEAPEGEASVADLWKALCAKRKVARTTVLTHVDRLDKRGWLKRRKGDGALLYSATLDRATVFERMAGQFIDEFFEGSASTLVASLLGSKKIDPDEMARLTRAIEDAEEQKEAEES